MIRWWWWVWAAMEPVVMEQMEIIRTDSVSPTSTSDSTEVDYQLKLLSSHFETPGSNYLDRVVWGLYFWNIILATVSDIIKSSFYPGWGVTVCILSRKQEIQNVDNAAEKCPMKGMSANIWLHTLPFAMLMWEQSWEKDKAKPEYIISSTPMCIDLRLKLGCKWRNAFDMLWEEQAARGGLFQTGVKSWIALPHVRRRALATCLCGNSQMHATLNFLTEDKRVADAWQNAKD